MRRFQAVLRTGTLLSLIGLISLFGTGAAHAQQTIGGCTVLPANNIWNTRVDTVPVLSNSAAMVNTIGATTGFHADFGSGTWNGGPIGIPFVTVAGSQTKYPASFFYAGESDPGPYAVPLNAPIEGGSSSNGDRHAIAIDVDNCILYELYRAFPEPASWYADSGAIFDLRSNALRPIPWTSADAAGLPIAPGLVTYEDVLSGEIRHAIRFTAPQTRREFVWPARHYASSRTGTQYPRMGERFRLKSSFDLSPFPADVQVILRAMKKYGIMLADNGSAWYISGKPDARWNNNNLRTLSQLTGSDFEAVDATVLRIDPNSGEARQPSTSSGNPAPLTADYDGDGAADVVVFRPGTGGWFVIGSATGTTTGIWWGVPGDLPVHGDYDGDGKSDYAVYRPASGAWFVQRSTTGSGVSTFWGVNGDVPVPADYDGDGRTDYAVYRRSTGVWYVLPSTTGSPYGVYWGMGADQPVPADFDGDGKADPTVFRPSTSTWYQLRSTTGQGFAVTWGTPGDIPLAGDYDGDGKADPTVFRSSSGAWFQLRSSGGAVFAGYWGVAGDVPMVGDFDGDGKDDLTVFRPSTSVWYQLRSLTGGFAIAWGLSGDIPM